jgi:hypothetical protein
MPGLMPLLPLAIGGLATLAAAIWASADASSKPAEEWERAGQSRTLWVLLPVVSLVAPVPGLAVARAIAYAVAVRPQLTPAG